MEKEMQLLKYIIDQLVEKTDEVNINREEDEWGTLLTLTVSKEEMGRVIGKNGKTIQAIRNLLRILGAKDKKRITLKVVEPEETK
jgi:uncharacterized protein